MVAVGEVSVLLTLDRSKFDRSMAELQRMGDLRFNVLPKVDHKELVRLNEHLEKKKQHATEINRWFQSNPITPKVDFKQLDTLDRRIFQISKPITLNVRVNATEAEKKLESLRNRAAREIRTRIKLEADLEIKQQKQRIEEATRGKQEDNRQVIGAIKELKDASKSTVGGGIISGIGQQIGFLIASRLIAGLQRNFNINIKTQIDKAVDSASVPVKILFTENPQFLAEIEKGKKLLQSRFQTIGYSIGDGIVAAIDQDGATVSERIKTFLKTAFDTDEFRQKLRGLADDFQKTATNVATSVVNPNTIGQIAPKSPFSLSAYREQALKERAIPLVIQRAQEELQNTKMNTRARLSSGRVVDETTNELIIATGGYAGYEGKSGMAIAADLGKDPKLAKAGVKVISTSNKETDIPEASITAKAKMPDNPTIKALVEAMGVEFGWMKEVAKSLGRPNVRGYSNDAIEMAAQALVALEKNPEIKVKFFGESGGGFVAEEAAKILQLMGYKNVEYLGVGTPEFIGGLNAPGKKILSPDEEVGQSTGGVFGPLGLANQSQLETIRGVVKHPSRNYKGISEYQDFVYGQLEPPSPEMVSQMSAQAMAYDDPSFRKNLRADVATGKTTSKTVVKQALENYEGARRLLNVAPEELKSEIQKIADVYLGIYTEFADEPKEFAKLRREIKAAKGELAELKRQPGLESGLRADQIVKRLKEAQSELEKEAAKNANTPRAFIGTLADKQNALANELSGLLSELESPAVRIKTDTDLSLSTQKLIKNINSFSDTVQVDIESLQKSLQSSFADPDLEKDVGDTGNKLENVLTEVGSQLKILDDIVKKSTGKAQQKYKNLAESLRDAQQRIEKQAEIVASQKLELQIKSASTTGTQSTVDFFEQPSIQPSNARLSQIDEEIKSRRENIGKAEQQVDSELISQKEYEQLRESNFQELRKLERKRAEIINATYSQYQQSLISRLDQPNPSKAFIPDPFASRPEQMMQRGQSIVSRLRDRFFGGEANQQIDDAGGALAVAGQQGGALSIAGTAATNLVKTVLRLAGTKAEEVAVARINELLARTPGQPGVITVNPRQIQRISDLTPFDVGKLSRLGFDDLASTLGPVAGLVGNIGQRATRGTLQGVVQTYAALQGAERGVLGALPFGQSIKGGLKLMAGAGGALMLANAVPGGQMALGAATDAIQGGLALPGNALAATAAKQLTELLQQTLNAGQLSPENLSNLRDIASQIQNLPKIGGPAADAVRQFVQVVENVPGSVGAAAQQLLSTINGLVTGGAATVLAPVAAGKLLQAGANRLTGAALDAAGVDTSPLALPAARADAFTLPAAREKLALPAASDSIQNESKVIVVQAQEVVDIVLDKFNQFSNSLKGAKEQAQSLPAGNQIIDVVAQEVNDNYKQTVDGFKNRIFEIGREFNIARDRMEGDRKAAGAVQSRILADLTDLEKDLRTALKKLSAPERTGTKEGQQLAQMLGQITTFRNNLIAVASGRPQISAAPNEPVNIVELRKQLSKLGESFTKLASFAKSSSKDSTQRADSLKALIQEAERARAVLDAIEREGGITSKTDPTTRKRIAGARTQITNAITSANKTAKASGIDLTDTGAAIPEGIAQGVKDRISELEAVALNLSQRFKKVVKGEFEIQSPSGWGKYIGKMIGLGIKVGLQSADIASDIIQTIRPGKQKAENIVSSYEEMQRRRAGITQIENKSRNPIIEKISSFFGDGQQKNAASSSSDILNIGSKNISNASDKKSFDRLAKSGERTSNAFELVGRSVNFFRNAIDGVENFLNNLIPGVDNLGTSLKFAVGGFLGFQVASQVIPVLTQFTKGALDAAINLDRLKTGLNFAVGGSAQGAKDLEFVRNTVDQLGIPLDAAQKGFVQLAASTRNTAVEGKGTKDVFTGISQAATVLGLSAEDTSGAILALSQIASKGKLSAEELRQQLGERLPGATGIAARALGITETELNKLLETGSIFAEDFLPKFGRQLQSEFGGTAESASQNLQSSFFKLNNAFQLLQEGIGSRSAPRIKIAVDAIAATLKFVADNLQVVFSVIVGLFTEIGVRLLPVVASLKPFGLFVNVLIQIQGAATALASKVVAAFAGITFSIDGAKIAVSRLAGAFGTLLKSIGPFLIASAAIEGVRALFERFGLSEQAQEFKNLADSAEESFKKIGDAADVARGKVKDVNDKSRPNRKDLGFDLTFGLGGLVGLQDGIKSDALIRQIQKLPKPVQDVLQTFAPAISPSAGLFFGLSPTDKEGRIQTVSDKQAQNELEQSRRQLSVIQSNAASLSEGVIRTEQGTAIDISGQLQTVANLEEAINQKKAERAVVASAVRPDKTRLKTIDEEVNKLRERRDKESAPIEQQQALVSAQTTVVKQSIESIKAREKEGKLSTADAQVLLDIEQKKLDSLDAQQEKINRFNSATKTSVSISAELANKFAEVADRIEGAKLNAELLANSQLLRTRGTDLFATQRANITRIQTQRQETELGVRELQQLTDTEANKNLLGQIPIGSTGQTVTTETSIPTLQRLKKELGQSPSNAKKVAAIDNLIQLRQRQSELTGLQLQEADANQALATAQLDQNTQRRGLAIRQDESSRTVDLRRRQRLLGLRDTDVAVSQAQIALGNTSSQIEGAENSLEELRARQDISKEERFKRETELVGQLADLKKQKAEQELALQNTIGERALANLNLQNQKVQDQIQRTEAAQISGLRRRQRTQNLNPEDVAVEEQQIGLQSVDKRLIAEQNNLKRLNELRAKGEIDKVKFEDNERQSLNNISDLKKQKAEQELSLQNAINARIIENLQRANQLAEASIKATTTQRITDIKRFALLPGAGELTDQAINRASGNAEDEATRRTIELKKVELEQNRKLFAERRINQKQFQDTEIRINQEILDLNQQRVDKLAALEKQLRDAKIRYIEESAKAAENSIGREIELLRARQGLVQAQSQARLSSLEGQLGQTDRALGLAQKLRDPNLDPGVRSEITSQLNQSGFGTDEESILNRKFELENAIAAARENASRIEYENQLKVLELEFKKNELAAQREEREARRAQLDAQQGQLVAEDELRKAKKSGDPESIANAQKGVEIADEIKKITDIGVQQAGEGIKQAKELYEIELQTLQVKREQTLEEERQAAIRRDQDQRLTRAENRASQRQAAIDAFADGGIAQGMALVGERGPELAIFNQPTQILPAEVTRRILSDVNVNMDSTRVVAGITPNVSANRFSSDLAFHLMRMADAAEKMGNAQWNQSNSFTVVSERENSLDQVLKLHRGIMHNRLG